MNTGRPAGAEHTLPTLDFPAASPPLPPRLRTHHPHSAMFGPAGPPWSPEGSPAPPPSRSVTMPAGDPRRPRSPPPSALPRSWSDHPARSPGAAPPVGSPPSPAADAAPRSPGSMLRRLRDRLTPRARRRGDAAGADETAAQLLREWGRLSPPSSVASTYSGGSPAAHGTPRRAREALLWTDSAADVGLRGRDPGPSGSSRSLPGSGALGDDDEDAEEGEDADHFPEDPYGEEGDDRPSGGEDSEDDDAAGAPRMYRGRCSESDRWNLLAGAG